MEICSSDALSIVMVIFIMAMGAIYGYVMFHIGRYIICYGRAERVAWGVICFIIGMPGFGLTGYLFGMILRDCGWWP